MPLPCASVPVQATHRPSCEKTAFVSVADRTPSTRFAFLSAVDDVQSEAPDEPWITSNEKTSPRGIQDSGTCDVPGSGVVRRSAALAPSAVCQKMARSPSRSDWNAMRCPSADQIGNRLRPPNVKRRMAVAPSRPYTHTIDSFPSSVAKVIRVPSGDTRGCWYVAAGSFSGCGVPVRSITPRSFAADSIEGPGTYRSEPVSETLNCAEPVVPLRLRLTPSSTCVGLPTISRRLTSKGTANRLPPTAYTR